jgi:four helix bundle protein
MAASFEDLWVYQASEELADLVWEIVSRWTPLAKDTAGKQLIRCADSVAANIAEGHRRKTCADKRRFVAIARGSLYETRHFLRRAHKRGLLTESETEKLRAIIDALPRALNACLKSIGRTPIANDQ